jgi:DmsE family decaheme c-type cytochrome
MTVASKRRRNRPLVLGALSAMATTLAVTLVLAMPDQPVGQQEESAASTAIMQSASNDYVGADTCLTCHEDKKDKLWLHGRAENPRTPMSGQGCESCHGPGKAHIEAGGDAALIRNPQKLQPREGTAICTTCHNRGEHRFWDDSMHDQRQLTCTTCHSVHSPESLDGQLVKENQLQVCAKCHRDKVAKLDRSGHMPVREGKLQCSSCHNMHGSQNVRLLRAGYSVVEACTSCHPEKRGPFLWEHPPVRENCTTCHDPHGSANERLLVAKQPFLCQRCHTHARHPATIYDAAVFKSSNRVYGRGCVNCHSAIHGSVHPAGMAFQR